MKNKIQLILLILFLSNSQAAEELRAKLTADEFALFKAAAVYDIETIKQLINSNVNVNIINPEEISIEHGRHTYLIFKKGETPLFQVVDHPNFNVAKALIDAGADVNAPAGKSKDTPLHTLVGKAGDYNKDEWPKIMEYLLERGANPLILNADGFTVFDLAFKKMNMIEARNKSRPKDYADWLIDIDLNTIKNIKAVIDMLNRHREIKENYQRKVASQVDECCKTFNLPPELTAITLSYIEAGDWEKNIKSKTQGPPGGPAMDLSEDL